MDHTLHYINQVLSYSSTHFNNQKTAVTHKQLHNMLVIKYGKGRKICTIYWFIVQWNVVLILLWYSPGGECLPVTVETIPPSFANMILTNSANLTCRISNIPVTAEYSKLNVTWTRASDHKQLHTVMTNFLDQENEFYYVDAIATVCATEWKGKETFTCKVTFEDVLVKPVEKTLEKESGKFLVVLTHEKHLGSHSFQEVSR